MRFLLIYILLANVKHRPVMPARVLPVAKLAYWRYNCVTEEL
jgi:hypothetical protein